MAEGVVLATLGGGAGLVLATVGLEAITRLAAATWIPRPSEVQIDTAVVVFILVVSATVGIFVGVFSPPSVPRAATCSTRSVPLGKG